MKKTLNTLLTKLLGPRQPARRTGPRPGLEGLEDRTVPSLFHVTSLLDTGAGSGGFGDLRYCVTQANANPGPNAIVLDVRGTITLNSALPALAHDVAILGPGPASLTVSANQAEFPTAFLTVNAGVTAGVSGLTLANAYGNPRIQGGGPSPTPAR
jgi:hypothetical protein